MTETLPIITDDNIRTLVRNYQIYNTPIGEWDVSRVTNMSRLFMHMEDFDESLEKVKK